MDVQSAQAIEIAEKAVVIRQNHPQAIEMLIAVLCNRTFVLLNGNRFEEGEKIARKSVKLSETLYPPHDPRYFKCFRGLGLALSRLDKLDEAESLLKQAYDVSSGVNGPCNPDSQLVVDDIIPIMAKRNNGSTVEIEKFLNV